MQITKECSLLGRIARGFAMLLLCLGLLIGFMAFFSAAWYVKVYGRIGFDSVLYTLTGGLGGVSTDLVTKFLSGAVLPALLCTLVLTVLLAGMILFQFPVVLYFLLWLGILDVAAVKDKRPLMIVLIFVAAAVLSPPDAFSQIVLAVPAWLLFELSLWFFSRRFSGRDRSYDEIYKDIE